MMMFTQWATRRLFKFLLKKRLGRYLRGELDLEQLDVQLGSGLAQLNDVALDVNHINTQLSDLSFELKEGSLGSVTLKVQWSVPPRIDIELDGVELVFVPRKSAKKCNFEKKKTVNLNEGLFESQNIGSLESEWGGVGYGGAYTYSPVQEGVRVVANLVESLLLGMHVSVRNAIIAFEGATEIGQFKHDMLVLRIGCGEYSINYSSDHESIQNGKDLLSSGTSLLLTNSISFEKMTLELLDVVDDDNDSSISIAGNRRVFGQPVSILQNDEDLSGCIKLSVPWKNGCLDILKLDADISISNINLQFTGDQIQQLMGLVSSYGECDSVANKATCQGYDGSESSQSKDCLSVIEEYDDGMAAQEAPAYDPAMLQSKISRSSILPEAKLISDWVHWIDPDKFRDEEAMSEADFAASTEEFFDCFDGTRSTQASLTGSGLWTWTCSAFNAITAASSLASGSILIPQDSVRQVEYDFKIKARGISIILKEGNTKEERGMANPGTKDRKSLVSWLSESVTVHADYLRHDHIEAVFSDIGISIQVSQKRLLFELTANQIEAFEIKYQLQDIDLYDAVLISSSGQSLQALTEKSLPIYPVSLCNNRNLANGSAMTKKCFLRFSDQIPAAQCRIEHEFSCPARDKIGGMVQNTNIRIHFQPLIVWLDASLINKLQKLSAVIGHGHNNVKTNAIPTEIVLTRSSVQLDIHIPSLRFLATAPHSPVSQLLKNHILCVDISNSIDSMHVPLFKLKLPDSVLNQSDPACVCSVNLAFRRSTFYLVSPSVSLEGSVKQADLSFKAQDFLNVSLDSSKLATVEMLLRSKTSGGARLAEQAWIGVTEQQKGGTGGRKTNPEFAAATATEAVDAKNERIREDVRKFSSTHVHVVIPHLKVELRELQPYFLSEFFNALTEAITFKAPESSKISQKDCDQISIAIDVPDVEIIVQSRVIGLNTGSVSSEMKSNSSWSNFMIDLTRFQLLHVMHIGMIQNASYFWLHHESASIRGSLLEENTRELPLLTCHNDVLGRGDGGGGNALATRSAGLEVSTIAWSGGEHAEDMLITVTIRGCTFIAHGGRLDWLPALIDFFSQPADQELSYDVVNEKFCSRMPATELCKLQVAVYEPEVAPSAGENCVLFSLDLHDAALCYEPGKEAVSAAKLRTRTEDPSAEMDMFSPVACAIAAAAVRVSSNAISNTASKDYEIWLRDVALLLADTTFRENRSLDYTPESLQHAGYVKVAGEAVMEAVVHINSDEGLKWEVECANNQLRLDTCHDTTAALGRLIAQLQQLFAPEVEHISTGKKREHDTEDGVDWESFENQSGSDRIQSKGSFSNCLNSEKQVAFEGISDDAVAFAHGTPLHAAVSLGDCGNLGNRRDETFEMLGKVEFSSDDGADESLCSSLDQSSRDGGEMKDYWTPTSQNDEAPSFIEDYYVAKKSSPLSSPSVSWKGSHNSQHCADDFDMVIAVEGSGGWYDGHSFKVLENHVPIESEKCGSTNQRGSLSHSSRKRRGLPSKYPESVGRVVLQDLNLRWRLYGGSDWVISQAHEGRKVGVCLEVICSGLDLQYDAFPETGDVASRMVLSIRDVRIYDCSKDAPWKKILGYYRSKSFPRESSAKALKLELESVRPEPTVPLEEYRLSLQLLPILLHLDQRHLDFLTNFFSASPSMSPQQLHLGYEEIFSPHLAGLDGLVFDEKMPEATEEPLLPFFQMCELQPFSIRVDYVPRRVDIGALRGGNYAELFNLVSWKGIELDLKHVRALGVHGWGTLSGVIVGEWLEDISRNQIHKLLKGLGPIRPLFAMGSGAAKLVVLPAEHYKRDRRSLLRGMRKGAMAFLRSISLEAVGLGVQLAAGAHEFLRQTESALGSVGLSNSAEKVETPAKLSQPGDVREGLKQACESLTRGLERTASSLIGNPVKVYQRGAGTSTAVASALRAAPAAAVAPAAAAVGAVHCALLGVQNSLDPEHKRESEEKHSGPPPESDPEMFL